MLMAAVLLVIAALYWARDVVIPVALAALLSFLLAPVVIRLQRWGLGRIPAVLAVVLLAFTMIGALGWIVAGQLSNLASQLPAYGENIQNKIRSLENPTGGALDRAVNTYRELTEKLSGSAPSKSGQSASNDVAKVEIVDPPMSAVKFLRNAIGPVLGPLSVAGIVIVLVIFILLRREDLRDRVIRLMGPGQVNITTQALDEAASRVSRYLLMQSIINGLHGLAVGTALFLLGVPNASLWGLLSAALRFIPYVGPLMAAVMPIALSLAVFDGWTRPLLTMGLFLVLEIVSNNIMEPWLYGARTGVSSLALILAALFWTWLWGSTGLILSTPLTVCLVVMGKYLPQLEFFAILLGDQPALDSKTRFYQRLLAVDQEEATELVEKSLKEESFVSICDTILVPSLGLAEQDRHRGILEEGRAKLILQSMNEIIGEVCEAGGLEGRQADSNSEGEPAPGLPSAFSVLCLPGRDEADEIAAMLFAKVLRIEGIQATFISVMALASEMVELVERHRPDVVCISALPPSALTHARYLSKRIRARFPDLPLLVGLWNAQGDLARAKERLEIGEASKVVNSFAQGLEDIGQLNQSFLLTRQKPTEPLEERPVVTG
jgi:predicted PurR-regulated permease PerM